MSLHTNDNQGSSTYVVELQPITIPAEPPRVKADGEAFRSLSQQDLRHESQDNDQNNFLPSPTTATEVVSKWNHPRINVYRTFSTFFSFLIMGANDAAYGVGAPNMLFKGLSY